MTTFPIETDAVIAHMERHTGELTARLSRDIAVLRAALDARAAQVEQLEIEVTRLRGEALTTTAPAAVPVPPLPQETP